jgi:hypothetical protein
MSLVLNVEILGEFKKLTQATTGSQKSLQTLEKKVGSISKGINRTLGAIGIGLSAAAFINFTKEAIRGAEAAEIADRRLLQVTESMNLFGNAANSVTARLSKFADTQELLTGVQAESIKQVQATLMTFGDLAKSADEVNGSFDRATKAALDLAAAGFGSAETNAIQLGKALNDPIKGLTALAKSGVTFTEAEKERIKVLVESNKIGEAQALILAAIEKQVGGTAAATVSSSARMEAAFGQVSDAVGLVLLPYLEKFTAWLASPGGQEKIQEIINTLVDLAEKGVAIVKWVYEYRDSLIPLAVGIGAVTTAIKLGIAAYTLYNTVTAAVVARNAAVTASNAALATSNTAVATTATAATTAMRLLAAAATVGAVLSLGGSAALPGTVPSTMPKPADLPNTPVVPPQQGAGIPGFGGTPIIPPSPVNSRPVVPTTRPTSTPKPTVVINNNVNVKNTTASPKQIVSSLQSLQSSTGVSIARLLK